MEYNKRNNRNNNNQNPYNNPLLQALLDVKRLLWDEGLDLDNIDDIITEFQDKSNNDLRERANQIWLHHQFPEKSIKFIMSLIYDKCPERFSLPLEEQAILGLLERIQCQGTGGVIVKKSDFVNVLNLTLTQRKKLQTSLDHLTQLGFLTCIYRPPKGSKKPGIYIVNRGISWIGSSNDNAPTIHIEKFTRTYKQTTEIVVLPDGKKMKCGTLSKNLPNQTPEQKNGVTADQNSNPEEPIPEDS